MRPEAAPPALFLVPGALASATGGYGYARALLAHLPQLIHQPVPLEPHALAVAAAQLPDAPVWLVDGLSFAHLPADLLARRQRRLVALIHHPLADEQDLADAARAALAQQERRALAHAAHVVVTSRTTADQLMTAYGVAPERLTVAPPGIVPAPRAAGTGDRVQLLCLGTVTRRKGHDVLLAALDRLQDLPWHLNIVGDPTRDPDWAWRIARQADSLGAGRVTLHGVCEPAALDALWQATGLFVLATRHEGYGMAAAEALSRGVPVVSCAVGAVPEVVPPQAGALVPADDAAALATALRPLLADPAARARAAAAAWQAGQTLPRWPETAATVARVLAQVAAAAVASAPAPALGGAP